jgi:hypothetical protein
LPCWHICGADSLPVARISRSIRSFLRPSGEFHRGLAWSISLVPGAHRSAHYPSSLPVASRHLDRNRAPIRFRRMCDPG